MKRLCHIHIVEIFLNNLNNIFKIDNLLENQRPLKNLQPI